ncbi:hypothetical protein O1D97_07030 [Marinomonas sp. 15G1-11]|uniref:Uncharacterized protein n=1 Tax=Marinomonas phaeophyticola TaxID=3004091 RepID=A0ABT4JV33_9GAMM|nr:hypothetical protein [Marinomonas sp. 15G1-11]MCZ2721409.1 hypothetical protein [Marinomonas sp. 15G1-11]
MKVVKEDGQQEVECPSCGLSQATYKLRDVRLGEQVNKKVLVAVCNSCDKALSVPTQTTVKIKSDHDKTRYSIDIRLPAHYLDILTLASHRINPALAESFGKTLILYYLHALNTERYPSKNLANLLHSDFAKAKSSKRLSMKISRSSLDEMRSLMENQGFKSNTDLLKSIILKIHDDIVLKRIPKHLAELQNLAAVFA